MLQCLSCIEPMSPLTCTASSGASHAFHGKAPSLVNYLGLFALASPLPPASCTASREFYSGSTADRRLLSPVILQGRCDGVVALVLIETLRVTLILTLAHDLIATLTPSIRGPRAGADRHGQGRSRRSGLGERPRAVPEAQQRRGRAGGGRVRRRTRQVRRIIE